MFDWDEIDQKSEDSLFHTSVWYEKYRPRKIEEMILPEHLKDKIRSYLKDGGRNLPHLGLFSKTPGTGKSSLAKAIINELKAESLWINASMDRGIDVLRTRIQQFASQIALKDSVKVVVLDEFDGYSSDGQAAFRSFIDSFPQTRFIFTANNKEKIIEPLLDRMEVIDFNNFAPSQIAKPILERLEYILEQEKVQYQREDLLKVIKSNFPRIRKMIGDLGAGLHEDPDGNKSFNYSFVGQQDKFDSLLLLMKQKDFTKAKTVCYSLSADISGIYGYFNEKLEILFDNKQEQIINAVLILGKYQYQDSFAKDKQLNALACCFELMRLL